MKYFLYVKFEVRKMRRILKKFSMYNKHSHAIFQLSTVMTFSNFNKKREGEETCVGDVIYLIFCFYKFRIVIFKISTHYFAIYIIYCYNLTNLN